MSRITRTAVLGLGLVASSFVYAGSPLKVDLVPVSGKASQALGAVHFSMTNTGTEPVTLLKYQTPFYGVEADIFDVSLGASPVEYVGMLVKRPVPTKEDFMTLAPGETRTATIPLSNW